MAEIKLTKNNFIPFLDITKGGVSPNWKRIDKSTIFSLTPNPQSESIDYICYESPIEEIDHYEPELPQEIALYEGNPMYDFMFKMFYNLPIGAALTVPALICFAGSAKKAWKVPECRIQLGELNTVDGKLSFTLKLGGDIVRGTYTISDGVPTFSANVSKVTYNVAAPVKGAEPQSTHDSGTGFTGAVTWSPTATNFAADTAYIATLTLTAAAGYTFDVDFSADDVLNLPATTGADAPATAIVVTRVSSSSATIAVTYAKTEA